MHGFDRQATLPEEFGRLRLEEIGETRMEGSEGSSLRIAVSTSIRRLPSAARSTPSAVSE